MKMNEKMMELMTGWTKWLEKKNCLKELIGWNEMKWEKIEWCLFVKQGVKPALVVCLLDNETDNLYGQNTKASHVYMKVVRTMWGTWGDFLFFLVKSKSANILKIV